MIDLLKNPPKRYDYLTQIYERSVIEDLMRGCIREKQPFMLVLIDVDNFKNINDGYGHAVGDKVIATVAHRLRDHLGDRGILGRFGGDEFIMLVPGITEYDDAWQFCRHMFTEMDGIRIEGYPSILITMTVGLSRFPLDAADYEGLFEKADKALYRGKIKGRSCFIIYLDSKHKNIKLVSSKDAVMNIMQVQGQIFALLQQSEDLRQSIPQIFKLLSVHLMIDHLALQGKGSLLFSEIYPLSTIHDFAYIDNELIMPNISNSLGVFYINEVDHMNAFNQEALHEAFTAQKIWSVCYVSISYGDTFYGILRSDLAFHRIWQHTDMNLLLTVAKSIGMILHYQHKTLDTL